MKKIYFPFFALFLFLSVSLAQNQQLLFDGVDDFCNVPNAETLFSNLDVFTVEVWINGTDFSINPIFIGSNSDNILFAIVFNSVVFGTYFIAGGFLVWTVAGALPADGLWHHVACVRAGPGVGQGKIYIDGVDQTDPTQNTPGSITTLSGNLTFGVGLGSFFINGAMDDLRIWNVERSQAEINNNMNVELAGNEAGLIGYWRFNEGSGQDILDSQTNGTQYNGTLGADNNTASDDPTRIQDSGLPLPVELTSFTANVNNEGNVILIWSTATEINNQMFEIERKSIDGQYATIGFVNGYGTTTEPQEYSFFDNTVGTGTYFYRLKQIDFGGQYEYSDEIEVEVNAPLTFGLDQNYPNPFNPVTTISYSIPVEGLVTLKLYNTLGEEVAKLVEELKQAGNYTVKFNATSLISGTYFYRLQTENYTETKKMILLK